MSQDYHRAGVFSFSNGSFERSQQQMAHQIRGDRLRIQGFYPPQPPPLAGMEEDESVYETSGILQEIFNLPSGGTVTTATELLENQISQGHRIPRAVGTCSGGEWFVQRQGSEHQMTNINADSAAAMQLFLMNPQRSPPTSPSQNPLSNSSTLHMLLPNSNNLQAFHAPLSTWNIPNSNSENQTNPIEGQGLSLSLSSSLQQFEAAKAGEGGMMFLGGFKNTVANHAGPGSSPFGVVNVLRNSKYSKGAQELLEEFCSAGRGQFNTKNKFKTNPSSDSSKDLPPLSASDRVDHQKRKVKLLSLLDEVDRRYGHYCEQMQTVVNSFDMVIGFGSAVPYTCLAQKAMSRHFRCLKDAISAHIKQTCEVLGERDAGTSGITKGETPRLRILEQSLRQQTAFHHMGIMEQEAWRPQRGLPERSVNILRAWLFEHFLHPYPSDADKHLLARQTGLSRNQVSNWFINARVRLWKPMVEEMYQREAKDEAEENDEEQDQSGSSINDAQTPTPHAAAAITPPPAKRSEINASENDPSFVAINYTQRFADNTNVSVPVAARRSHADVESPLIRFGASAGDVSLTLGLRHAGNVPEKSPLFS